MNKLKDKRILVTGGAGFIGSHLVDRLAREKPANLVVVGRQFLSRSRKEHRRKRKPISNVQFEELIVIFSLTINNRLNR